MSYAGDGRPYTASDTRRDLQTIARIVAREVASAPPPRAWLGHSQAALVLDRILADRLPSPDAAVDLAPPPPYPPPIRVPPPGVSGEGAAGGDVARVFAHVLSAVGIHPYDIDAPASPTNLQRIAVAGGVPRVAVWALGDSVWLDGDWRRRDEVNVIALTDHVGIANDPSALGTAQRFFAGRPVTGDESSWRATLVSMFSYAFAPWRP
jgi:hypothetical protein